MKLELRDILTQYRSKLWTYAYNILGDSMAAEDIVQEVLNRYAMDGGHIEKPDAYLVRAVINRSINEKDLLRNRKEKYPGKWLPVPVITEESIYAKIDSAHILNYSLLVLLERLTTKERAVFILKETYDFPHSEIAATLEIEEEHSRQLLRRAKDKLAKKTTKASAKDKDFAILQQLSDAILGSDVDKVKRLLAEEVQMVSDGGPSISAARKPIVGRDRSYKLLAAVYGKYFPEGTESRFATINHRPAIIYSLHGQVFRCIIFEIEKQQIKQIFVMVNPDKLKSVDS